MLWGKKIGKKTAKDLFEKMKGLILWGATGAARSLLATALEALLGVEFLSSKRSIGSAFPANSPLDTLLHERDAKVDCVYAPTVWNLLQFYRTLHRS